MIVEKAVKMAKLMDIPVLGIVENMSYFECPDCGKKHSIFGNSDIDTLASRLSIPLRNILVDSNCISHNGHLTKAVFSSLGGFCQAIA